MIKNFLVKIARNPLSSFFTGNIFQYFSFLLPVKKLYEDKSIVVFYHPLPCWQFHCLVVPKKKIPSFQELDLSTVTGCNLVKHIFHSLQRIASEKDLHDYKIIVNGGSYQDVPQLHFHLGSGDSSNKELRYKWQEPDKNHQRNQYQSAILYPCPYPQREVHYIITTIEDAPFFPQIDLTNQGNIDSLIDILILAQRTISSDGLHAYSLITEVAIDSPDPKLCFHLVSGRRIS